MEYNIAFQANSKLTITIINVNLNFTLRPNIENNENSVANIMVIPDTVVIKLIDIIKDIYGGTGTIIPSRLSLEKLSIKVDVVDYMDFIIGIEEDISVNPEYIMGDTASSNYYLKSGNYNSRYFDNSIIHGTLLCGIQFVDITFNRIDDSPSSEGVLSWRTNKLINITNAKIIRIDAIPLYKLSLSK